MVISPSLVYKFTRLDITLERIPNASFHSMTDPQIRYNKIATTGTVSRVAACIVAVLIRS
jgi:hypothetical protein